MMKPLQTLFVCLMLMISVIPITSQDDECSPQRVIEFFLTSIAVDDIDSFLEFYADKACPPNVEEAVQLLAEAHNLLQSELAPEPTPTITTIEGISFSGDFPVFQTANALGFKFDIQAQEIDVVYFNDTDTRNPVLSYYAPDNYFVISDSPYIYEFLPMVQFKHSLREDEGNILTLVGETSLQTYLPFVVRDTDTEQQANFLVDDVTLLSLPEAATETDYMHSSSSDTTIWQITIAEPVNRTYTIFDPRFYYSNRIPNCMGFCGGVASSSGFEIILDGQHYPVQFDDFSELNFSLQERVKTVAFLGTQGNQGSGSFYVDDTQHTMYIFAPIVDSNNYVAMAIFSDIVVTLKQLD